jgi:hypothetical protein
MTWGDRPPGQLWMMYMLECPVHTQVLDTDRRLASPRGLALHATRDSSNDGLSKYKCYTYISSHCGQMVVAEQPLLEHKVQDALPGLNHSKNHASTSLF